MNVEDIKVISADKDGADLKREQRGYYARCDGNADNEQIQDAVNRVGKAVIGPLGSAWVRIFGEKNVRR